MQKLAFLTQSRSWLSSCEAVLSARIAVLQNQLSLPQKLYFVAIVLLFTTDSVVWVAMISVIAMSIEFWHLFERMWHSLAGKAVLLLFYAIVANFALASSSSVVNDVVGVAASNFNYTHNFAILLYLPAWSVVMSCIVLLMLQLIFPLMFTVSFLLRPLGVKNFRLINHLHFHRCTFWVRVILAAVLLYHLAMLMDLYGQFEKALDDPQMVTLVEAETEFDDDGFTIVKAPSVEKEADKSPMVMTADEIVHEQELAAIDEIAKQPYNHLRSQYFTGVRKAIALFAFQLEANVKSRCKKLPQSHVVELNDYEILEITPDIKAEYGYHFEVKKCISPAFPL
ncbi:hypothetical protein CXF80_13660 [Shewanella sp. Actino-trap-3]|uniref:hypothetical protein n=1 Tax=Shewanella sp. Actino-trap-3 TaxID=2058331 RepID=UPI000C34C9AF|nr:hypothetical protein [Shewanella sp. Actino-trap-3]PKG79268.1 hypothetical protein CXF80_13660 [Shewanella sp. Actino-trap-3]